MTPEQNRPATKQDLDRAVESIAGEFTNLRQELITRIDNLTRTIERHTQELRLVELGQNAITKWADILDKDQTALGQNYFTQQRAIEDLRRRVEALERPQQ